MITLKLGIDYLRGTIKEILSLALVVILFPFRTSRLDLPTPGMESKPDILCVHGYLHNGSAWGYYRRKLQAAGAGPVNQLSYPTLTQDIPSNSLRIKARIDQIKSETGRDVNVLIGHSQGGIESLEYALEYAPKDKLIYVITLGSSLHGTKVARIGFGPSARQMEIGSPYIKSLHERLSKAGHIHLLALYSNVDFIVRPVESAKADEFPFAKTEEIPGLSHVAYFFSPRAIDKIISFLRASDIMQK